MLLVAGVVHSLALMALAGVAFSALPNAALIAFTGTPIREADRDTREVFGADIDVYDLRRAGRIAARLGRTVPVAIRVNPAAAAQGGGRATAQA